MEVYRRRILLAARIITTSVKLGGALFGADLRAALAGPCSIRPLRCRWRLTGHHQGLVLNAAAHQISWRRVRLKDARWRPSGRHSKKERAVVQEDWAECRRPVPAV